MKVEVVRAAELSAGHLAAWSAHRAADPDLCSPYFHPEFTRIVSTVRKDVFVALVDDGSAFFPHQRGAWRVGRPVGGSLSDFHGIIAQPDFAFDAIALVRGCGLNVWDFDHLLARQSSLATWQQNTADSPVIDLRAQAAIGSAKLRADAANRRRKLEREIGPLQFEMHTANGTAFSQLRSWKSAQYRASGGIDLFAVPWVIEVLARIQASDSPDFAGQLSVLRAGHRLVAAHFGMRSGGVLHYWFPAYDPELSKYSPGILLLLAIIEAASAQGIARIDLGKGDAAYKQRLANHTMLLAEGSVVANSWVRSTRRLRLRAEKWVRDSPLVGPARAVAGVLRRTRAARDFL